MRRRIISFGSVLVAVVALAVVLVNATLVDRRGPSVNGVRLSAPVEDQAGVAQTLTAIDIEFSEPVRTATVERRFRIRPYVAGAISWDGSRAIFTPSDRLPPDTEFTVTIQAGYEDLAGNVADGVLEYTFRTVGPPVVVATDPADGSEGVAPDAVVTITFDRLMDTSAVERAVRVEPAVPVTPSWSGRDLTLAFDAPLAFDTAYSVTVGTTAADTDGSRLRSAFSTRFSTVSAGLGVARTLPADGIAGVSVRAPIAVLFDRPIDPASVEGALSITPPVDGGLRVVGLPLDEAPGGPQPPATVLLLEPSQPLAEHTTYTVTLDPVVTLEGAPDVVAPGRTWSFTTGRPTPSGHNEVAFLTARSGNREVWLMNPDGSAQRQLTTGLAPVTAFDVTLDGARVAWAGGGVVRLMAVDGSELEVRTRNGEFEYAPRFSPDGRRLLVARRDSTGIDAGWWVVPLDGAAGSEVQVLPGGAPPLGSAARPEELLDPSPGLSSWSGRAAWDATGRWLLIVTAQGGLALVDLGADGGEAPAAQALALSSASAPVWSPDDDGWLVIARPADAQADALVRIGTDGAIEELAQATGSVAVDERGRAAVLVIDRGGDERLAIVADGGSPRPIATDAGGPDRWPTFSPDGSVVLFARLRDDGQTAAGIWSLDLSAGGTPRRLTTDGAYPRWLP